MCIDTEVAVLKRIPIFRGVDEAKLRLLAFISDRIQFHSGEKLCEQGEFGDAALIILDGEADVRVQTDDSIRTVACMKTNDIVGEIAILCDMPRTATVIANSDMNVLSISKDNFFRLLEEFPDMALEIMRVLALRLERTTRDLAVAKSRLPEV